MTAGPVSDPGPAVTPASNPRRAWVPDHPIEAQFVGVWETIQAVTRGEVSGVWIDVATRRAVDWHDA